MTKVKPIPDEFDCLTPYLACRDAAAAVDFYKDLFGAVEVSRMASPKDGKIMHAELKIRDSFLMLGEEVPQMNVLSPLSLNGPSPVGIVLYVAEVDRTFARAQELGVKVMMAPDDMFWGDRMCKFADPFGHVWMVATHIEEVSPEEMATRAAKACG